MNRLLRPPRPGIRRPGARFIAPAFPGALLLSLLAGVGCGGGADEATSEPAEEAPAPARPAPSPEEPVPVAPPPPPAPTTGSLRVSGADGADVFLDGRPLGSAPGAWDDLEAGDYTLRVEREDFHPFEVDVTVPAGRTRSVAVELRERLGSIVVEADVPGAMVFLDRNFKGNTPLTIEELRPGDYRLTVSAEGREVQNRTVTVERRLVEVRFELVEEGATLAVEIELVHKHRFGSCSGVLHAGPDGFDYRTDHQDAFRLPFGRVEEFELDYVRNNLRLKVLRGRTYNFESPSEDRDALFVFHKAVTDYRDASSED